MAVYKHTYNVPVIFFEGIDVMFLSQTDMQNPKSAIHLSHQSRDPLIVNIKTLLYEAVIGIIGSTGLSLQKVVQKRFPDSGLVL